MLDKDKSELWSRVAHGEKEIRFPSHMGIAGHVASTGESVKYSRCIYETTGLIEI